MESFYKKVLRTSSEYFCSDVFNKKNFPEIQDKILFLAFNHAKERVSFKNVDEKIRVLLEYSSLEVKYDIFRY